MAQQHPLGDEQQCAQSEPGSAGGAAGAIFAQQAAQEEKDGGEKQSVARVAAYRYQGVIRRPQHGQARDEAVVAVAHEPDQVERGGNGQSRPDSQLFQQ